METEEEEVNMELEEYNHHVEASTPEEEEEEEHEDPAYEFDAPRYYDFAQTETHLQALEAEGWFDSAASYPPSPFLSKMNLVKVGSGEENVSPRRMNSTSMDTDCGVESAVQQVGKNIVKVSSSSHSVLIRGSTLMKPTVSHLAKHRHPHEIKRLLRSRKLRMHSRTTTSQSDNAATKRQKLEIGYLKKDAQLKHQAVLSHKLCKKAMHNNNDPVNCSRPPPKVTVPKEPQLETARRAQRRRSKISVESSKITKSDLLPPPNARTPFIRKTVDLEDDAAENKRQSSAEASNTTKHESPYRFKARKLEKVLKLSKAKHEMPIRLFEKMTLEPESQNHSTHQSNKVMNEARTSNV